MILKPEEGTTIYFYKTKMVFKTTLAQSGGQYSTILMTHIPHVGPALHLHPNGPETFFVVEGEYTFTLNDNIIEAKKGDFVLIPANAPHKYTSGPKGGQLLVNTPPDVETYFLHIAQKLLQGEVPRDYEFEFARQHGQTFLDSSGHWGHK